MLVVLAEINCLESLKKKGVHPDAFYTDFDEFKHRVVFMQDATIIVIFAGNCRFNKNHTLEFVKTLMKRAETKADDGIKRVFVVSDMTLAGLRSYYKYTGNIDRVDIMHGWTCQESGVDIWSRLQTPEVKTKCFLSKFDRSEVDAVKEQYEKEVSEKDQYQGLIVVPDVRKLLAALQETAEATDVVASEA